MLLFNTRLAVCVLLVIFECCKAQYGNSTGESAGAKESNIIEKLLENYDKNVRPGAIGDPVVLNINIYLRIVNYLDGSDKDEASMSVSMTFRESWADDRLKFSASDIDFVVVPNDVDIWFPDTIFQNEIDSAPLQRDQHDRLVRIYRDGTVLMSQRLQHRFHCPMNLHWYPFDRAVCNIDIASYSYTEDDIKFEWKNASPIQLSSYANMPQFSIREAATSQCTAKTNTGVYGCLRVTFFLDRTSGDRLAFALFFSPGILVGLSWVGFILTNWRRDGIGLIVLVLLLFLVIVGQIYSNFPQVRYSFVQSWISGCGYIIVAELIFLIVLKLANDVYMVLNPSAQEKGSKSESGSDPTAKSVTGKRWDYWAIPRMLGLIIFMVSFMIFAIVVRGKFVDNS